MNKLKSLLGSMGAVLYFVFLMSFVILLLVFYPIMFPSEVSSIRDSGFAGPNNATSFIGVCGLIIGLSTLIPPLRKMYYAFPWLYSFVKIFFVNLIILCIGITILNYGYQTVNEARHTLFFTLMIIQIIVSRIAMCIYFKIKPVKFFEERLYHE